MKNQISLFLGLLLLTVGAFAATDPTKPYSPLADAQTVSESTGALTLTAVYIYPTYRMAIINGQIFKVGDQINEFTISSIEQNTVELVSAKSERVTLTLGTMVKQKSAT